MSRSKIGTLLADYPVSVQIPVQWGDMDAYGHVNNTVFFRYFESARIALLEKCGFLETYERDGIGAILHSTSCRFRTPLRHPDAVMVGARALEIGTDRFTTGYCVVSIGHEALVAEGIAVVVSFDYRAREKTALPPSVRAAIESLRDAAGGAKS